jgi:hypothetical protein
MTFDLFRKGQQGRIINPFAPKAAEITIGADFQTGQVTVKSNTALPLASMISLMLAAADALVKQWLQADQLLIKPDNKNEPTQEGGKGGNNGA